jgi:outer membrane biosynthesis protein TonB
MSSTAPQLRSRLPHVTPRLAQAALERARLTVVPRRRTRAPRVPFVTFVSVILLAGVVGLLLFNTSMQQASFRATALEKQATDLGAQQEALEMDIQALREPARVAGAAQALGMVMPSTPAGVLDLGTGRVKGEPTPATAADSLPLYMPGPRKPAELTPRPVRVKAEVAAAAKPKASAKPKGNRKPKNRGDGAPARNR